MKIIALYNMKGGVGKTASCVNLAYLSALEGEITLLWDLDPQGAATYYFNQKAKLKGGAKRLVHKKTNLNQFVQPTPYNRLDIIPADISNRKMDFLLDDQKKSELHFKKMLKDLKQDYNYIFIDCPPILSLLAENIFHAADLVLFPMIPTTLSERVFQQVEKYFDRKKFDANKLVPFYSMVDVRKKLHKETMYQFSSEHKQTMATSIPSSSLVERMGVHQAPLLTFSQRSKPAQAYKMLWKELKQIG